MIWFSWTYYNTWGKGCRKRHCLCLKKNKYNLNHRKSGLKEGEEDDDHKEEDEAEEEEEEEKFVQLSPGRLLKDPSIRPSMHNAVMT